MLRSSGYSTPAVFILTTTHPHLLNRMSIDESFDTRRWFHLVGFVDGPKSNFDGRIFDSFLARAHPPSATRIPTAAVYAHGHAASGFGHPCLEYCPYSETASSPPEQPVSREQSRGPTLHHIRTCQRQLPRLALHEPTWYIWSLQTIMRVCPSWALLLPFCVGAFNWGNRWGYPNDDGCQTVHRPERRDSFRC